MLILSTVLKGLVHEGICFLPPRGTSIRTREALRRVQIYASVRMGLRGVYVYTHAQAHNYICVYSDIYIYIYRHIDKYMYAYVYMCICVLYTYIQLITYTYTKNKHREGERERDRNEDGGLPFMFLLMYIRKHRT